MLNLGYQSLGLLPAAATLPTPEVESSANLLFRLVTLLDKVTLTDATSADLTISLSATADRVTIKDVSVELPFDISRDETIETFLVKYSWIFEEPEEKTGRWIFQGRLKP